MKIDPGILKVHGPLMGVDSIGGAMCSTGRNPKIQAFVNLIIDEPEVHKDGLTLTALEIGHYFGLDFDFQNLLFPVDVGMLRDELLTYEIGIIPSHDARNYTFRRLNT